jgi:hypothetical protein
VLSIFTPRRFSKYTSHAGSKGFAAPWILTVPPEIAKEDAVIPAMHDFHHHLCLGQRQSASVRTQTTAGKACVKWGKTVPKGAKRGDKQRPKRPFWSGSGERFPRLSVPGLSSDRTAEDACQVRKGSAPHALAVLNSFLLSLFNFCEVSNVKQFMRQLDAFSLQAVSLLTRSLLENEIALTS